MIGRGTQRYLWMLAAGTVAAILLVDLVGRALAAASVTDLVMLGGALLAVAIATHNMRSL